jgi:hypothetical protein
MNIIQNQRKTKITIIFEYQEPASFRRAFQGWTTEKYPMDKLNLSAKQISPEDFLSRFQERSYTKDELLKFDTLPQHLDRKNLESYLSEGEFRETFKIEKEIYNRLPLWKKQTIKREAGF